jgi:hypothetical protein
MFSLRFWNKVRFKRKIGAAGRARTSDFKISDLCERELQSCTLPTELPRLSRCGKKRIAVINFAMMASIVVQVHTSLEFDVKCGLEIPFLKK